MESKEYKEFLSKDIARKRLTFQTTITRRKYALYYGIDARWREKLKDDRYEVILDAIDKLGQYEDIEQELGIDLIEAKYVLDNANMTIGYTRDGKPIQTDYGYIEEFIDQLREALKK